MLLMRNYVHKQIQERRQAHEQLVDEKANELYNEESLGRMNAVRGSIQGDGQVSNCFVFGDVTIGEGSVLIDSMVDAKVTLIIGKNTKVLRCSFHPYMEDGGTVPTVIIIGDNCTIALVWAANNVQIGNNCRVFVTMFQETGTNYGSKSLPKGIVFGDNCLVQFSYLKAHTIDSFAETSLSIGDNAYLYKTNITVLNGTATVGKNMVALDYNTALRMFTGGVPMDVDTTADHSEIPSIVGHYSMMCGFDMSDTSLTIGDNFYLGSIAGFNRSYEKMKEPYVKFGNDLHIVPVGGDDVSNAKANITVYQLDAGNCVTLGCENDGWYRSPNALRGLTVGDNAIVIFRNSGSSDNFSGIDKMLSNGSVTYI